MTENIEQLANQMPDEITDAVESLNSRRSQAILVLLYDNDQISFTELRERLGDDGRFDKGKLNYTLDKLSKGGLIQQKIRNDDGDPFTSYYQISEYGERLVRSLFDSLGSVQGTKGRRRPDIAFDLGSNVLYDSINEVSKEVDMAILEEKHD